jgi:hypothetical protein
VRRFEHGYGAHTARMSNLEPGLDLHEWETRWAELEEALEADPRTALSAACDTIEEIVGDDFADDDLDVALASARETADRIERGEEVDAGDVGAAVGNLRAIRDRIRAGRES